MAKLTPIVVTRARTIVVPSDVLWQIIEPAENLPAWLPLCTRCERLSGEGLGRRQRMFVAWGRREGVIDQEVTVYVPGARLGWRHLEERLDGKPAPRISSEVTTQIELHDEGAGTRVVLRSRSVPAGLSGAVLLRLVARARIRKAFDRALEILAGSGG
jgi:Polyketide cyclase / dehydrase and lipid transport